MGSTEVALPPGLDLKNPSLFISNGLVAGQWRAGASEKAFSVIEPSSGKELSTCADLALPDFIEAIDSAYDGYKIFSTSTTAKERGILLRQWNDLILENVDDRELCETTSSLALSDKYSGDHPFNGEW
jgi:succinate-semialdehyde dehydrogenase/glutarate-semialdehyde dehydrogenase